MKELVLKKLEELGKKLITKQEWSQQIFDILSESAR